MQLNYENELLSTNFAGYTETSIEPEKRLQLVLMRKGIKGLQKQFVKFSGTGPLA